MWRRRLVVGSFDTSRGGSRDGAGSKSTGANLPAPRIGHQTRDWDRRRSRHLRRLTSSASRNRQSTRPTRTPTTHRPPGPTNTLTKPSEARLRIGKKSDAPTNPNGRGVDERLRRWRAVDRRLYDRSPCFRIQARSGAGSFHEAGYAKAKITSSRWKSSRRRPSTTSGRGLETQRA